mmetsp:Transcript_280/g.528  ORF Transcript_280/g.528 Transcript_280/m.528 type:complete len:84 (-) Transcript_280:48-299(-)
MEAPPPRGQSRTNEIDGLVMQIVWVAADIAAMIGACLGDFEILAIGCLSILASIVRKVVDWHDSSSDKLRRARSRGILNIGDE